MGKKNSKLSKADLQEVQDKTNLSRKEIKKWHKGFIRDCPDGKLTLESFKGIYQQFFPSGDPTQFTEIVFEAFDADHSGFIEFKEFICALSIATTGSLEQKLKWIFQLYDLNDDGQIARAEMLKITNAIYVMMGNDRADELDESTPQMRVDKIFAAMDKNHDDVLTWEEFQEGAKCDPTILRAMQAEK